MVQRVSTVAFEGIEVRPVDVQVAPGLPAFNLVDCQCQITGSLLGGIPTGAPRRPQLQKSAKADDVVVMTSARGVAPHTVRQRLLPLSSHGRIASLDDAGSLRA
jgi:hypothetical protein